MVGSASPPAVFGEGSTGGYPYANAVCEFGSAGGQSCVNPSNRNDLYDWGYWSGGTFEPYDQWGYEYRNCTSYVAWKLSTDGVSSSLFKDLGNADQWIGNVAGKAGVVVTRTPSVGAVAVWDSPGVGHVAWVESVNGATVTVSDYNYQETGNYDEHPIASTPTDYIDFPGGTWLAGRDLPEFGECGPEQPVIQMNSEGTSAGVGARASRLKKSRASTPC
jgi:surface antigen